MQIPDGVSITVTPGQGTAVLMVGRGDTITLPGVQDEIAQVCPIANDKLLIFGSAAGAYNIVVFDEAHRKVTYSFYAYDPKLSPDQRWIISRLFYPPQSEVGFSEEYVLYDLSKSAKKNSTAATDQVASEAERVIYPLVDTGQQLERTALPPEHTHKFCSDNFYWSPDSRFRFVRRLPKSFNFPGDGGRPEPSYGSSRDYASQGMQGE